MGKRGENIYRRKDGRWEGRYKKSRSKDGRIIYGYIYGKKYNEVRKKLLEIKVYYPEFTGELFDGTLSEWLEYWLYTAIQQNVKLSTWTSYESKIRNHINPFLGKEKLHLIEKRHINAFLQQLSTRKYSENTTKNIFTILSSSLNYAVENGYLAKNPCKGLSLSSKGKLKDIRALSVEQQKKLEELAFKDTSCSAVIIGLATGMRVGEISALRWSDIDFDYGIINVNRTLQRVPDPTNHGQTKVIVGSPKTQSSLRKIPLAKNLREYLLEKKRFSRSEYVVCSKQQFAEPRVINYRLKKLIKGSGIEPFHFHTLRHTFATRCIENNIDVSSLSKLLGHTSVKLTLDTYTDSLWKKRKEAMETIDSLQFKQL
ncbi:site-specific integrase [uncultured Enterococcus sp.]|uniref:tyrosine-type recombinase/integrase n=1 Tax=uncultured Enterococcus sp. TaxID=167972 RepID=UPI002AA64ABB|nr:site-specific integrase [uncultured Enterococcus sp.]